MEIVSKGPIPKGLPHSRSTVATNLVFVPASVFHLLLPVWMERFQTLRLIWSVEPGDAEKSKRLLTLPLV